MIKFQRSALAALSLLLLGAQAHATAVIVTPADMSAVPTVDKWYVDNVRGLNTTAAITSAYPRNTTGSAQLSTDDRDGKGDFVYYWGSTAGHTLDNLKALSFDSYRDGSSTTAAHFAPALRLVFDADGSLATTGDRGYLIWESAYNGAIPTSPVATDTWVSSNIIGDKFWQRKFGVGTIEDYDTNLLEWMAGEQPAGAAKLSGASLILGMEFGIGGGWGGTFRGAVDNVTVGFGADNTTFNFETRTAAVPEPGSLALLGLGLMGLAAGKARRRKS